MKTIIAGSRSISDKAQLEKAIEQSGFTITEVVSGMAGGVDKLGYYWAFDNQIKCKQFTADWAKYGLKAGPIRNGEMAKYADALIAVWDGKSKGTKDMIEQANKKKLKVFVLIV